jgi:hypothetical protein
MRFRFRPSKNSETLCRMAGLARFFRRAAGDPVEIAMHNLGAFSETGPHIYHANIEYIELLKKALHELESSGKSWAERETYYDRIAGKVVKSNKIDLLTLLYYGGEDENRRLVDGTGRTMNGRTYVKHIDLLSALVRRGVPALPVNIQGMAILRSQVLDRTDSIPDTLRYVDNAIRLGADINEIFDGETTIDRLLFNIDQRDTPHEKRERFQGLIRPLQERGARRFSEITQTPDQLRSIVDKEGLKRELYNVAMSTAFNPESPRKHDIFGIPAVCRFLATGIPRIRGVPLEPFFVIVKNLLYIYVDVEPVAYVYGDIDPATRGYVLEFRNDPRPTDVLINIEAPVPAPVAAPVLAPVEEVIRRLRAMPDLLQQLDFMKDGHDASGRAVTTIADMPATYTASTNGSSDDVFIVNGTVQIRIKNGITGSTEPDDIVMGAIPAARRRKSRVNRRSRSSRSSRSSRRNQKS